MIIFGQKERVAIFAVGFAMGLLLIGFIHKKRAEDGPEGTESMAKKVIRDVVSASGIRPLPEGTPEILRQSRLYSFDVIKSPADQSETTVWMLEMLEGMWPWVRVSSKVLPGKEDAPEVSVIAGDRILVALQDDATLDQFKELIAAKGLEYIRVYQKSGQHVIAVDPGLPLAIPTTLARLERASTIVQSAQVHPLSHF